MDNLELIVRNMAIFNVAFVFFNGLGLVFNLIFVKRIIQMSAHDDECIKMRRQEFAMRSHEYISLVEEGQLERKNNPTESE